MTRWIATGAVLGLMGLTPAWSAAQAPADAADDTQAATKETPAPADDDAAPEAAPTPASDPAATPAGDEGAAAPVPATAPDPAAPPVSASAQPAPAPTAPAPTAPGSTAPAPTAPGPTAPPARNAAPAPAPPDADDPALTTQPAPIVLPPPSTKSRTRMGVPSAQEPAVTVSADMFSRYELRANVDELAYQPAARFREGDRVAYRARFGLLTRPVHFKHSSTRFYFEPQAAGFWGQPSGGLSDASLGLHQGYMQLRSGMVQWELGRFELSYGDDLIIGSVPWNEFGRAFDGTRVRLQRDADAPWVDLFFTAVAEGSPRYTANVGEGDQYFLGAYSGLGSLLGPKGPELDVYLLGNVTAPTDQFELTDAETMVSRTADRDGAVRVTVGARVKGKRSLLDYRGEAGLQLGSALQQDAFVNRGVFAYHADAEVGVTFDKARVSLEGVLASGDDPETDDTDEGWAQLYPTAHKFLGLSDVFGARNDIAGGVLHLSYGVWSQLLAKLDAHFYSKPQRDDSYTGSEVDAYLVYDIGGGLKSRLLYAITLPNKDVYGDDAGPVHYLEIELRQRL